MEEEIIVPAIVFGALAYIAKIIGDTRIRGKIIKEGVSPALARELLGPGAMGGPVVSSLKWGLVVLAVGVALMVTSIARIGFDSPLAYGFILMATGVGLVAYYFIARNEDEEVTGAWTTDDAIREAFGTESDGRDASSEEAFDEDLNAGR